MTYINNHFTNVIGKAVKRAAKFAQFIAAFWLWFGVLSFVISVVGTLLAFASLVLLDPRLHAIRNRKSRWKGVAERFSLLFFAVSLRLLPAIGAGDHGDWWDQFLHLILPAFSIGLSWVGYIARLVRASMLETMGENHIRTAKAFGLPNRWITYRYALRLAILPTITVIGVGMGFLLSAAVFAEIVFSRPGLGKLVIDSISTRNYPIVMGSVLVSTIIFVASTTLSDIINAILDPRIRKQL